MSDDEVCYYTKEYLGTLIKQNATCPPRVVFNAECDQGTSKNLSCKITLKGVSVKCFDEEPFFLIPKISPPSPSHYQNPSYSTPNQVLHPTLDISPLNSFQSSGYGSNLERSESLRSQHSSRSSNAPELRG